jgi:hypothetical protein
MTSLDPGANGENVDALLAELERLHKLGVAHVHGRFPGMSDLRGIEILAERVIPVVSQF